MSMPQWEVKMGRPGGGSGTFVIGVFAGTPDLARRIKLHNSGKGAKYTRDRRPVKLVWSKQFAYFKLAFKAERLIKKLGRSKREQLVKYCKHPRRALYERAVFAVRRRKPQPVVPLRRIH